MIETILGRALEEMQDVPRIFEVLSSPILGSGFRKGDPQPQDCLDLISGETIQYTFSSPHSKGARISMIFHDGRGYELFVWEPLPWTVYQELMMPGTSSK